VGSPPGHPLKILEQYFFFLGGSVFENFLENVVNLGLAVAKISLVYDTKNLLGTRKEKKVEK